LKNVGVVFDEDPGKQSAVLCARENDGLELRERERERGRERER
jgi:hypothetical protein